MTRAITFLVLAACGTVAQKEVQKFPRGAEQPELERLLPEMKAGFPEERGKALKIALVHPHGYPHVEAGKTHRRIAVWVGVERGSVCFVEMHDYDQTKTDDGWTPPKWMGRSPREQQDAAQDAAIGCSELRREHPNAR
jgi:hypothetical protein